MSIEKTYYTFDTELCLTNPRIIKVSTSEILDKIINNDNYHCHYFSEPDLCKKALSTFLSDRLRYSAHGNVSNSQELKKLLNKVNKASLEELFSGLSLEDVKQK